MVLFMCHFIKYEPTSVYLSSTHQCIFIRKFLYTPRGTGHDAHLVLSNIISETSLVVQWLRLHAPNAEGLGLIPGQGTRSHMLQPSVHMPQQKILLAAMIEDSVCHN